MCAAGGLVPIISNPAASGLFFISSGRDEARRIAGNVAKPPQLSREPKSATGKLTGSQGTACCLFGNVSLAGHGL
jgi:hypothetical protein